MWLAKVDWGVIGPILSGGAAFSGLVYAAWERWQKRRAIEAANGKLAGAFKLIDELQEQLKNEWDDKAQMRATIRSLQKDFDATQDEIRRSREVAHENDQLFQENQELKRRNSILTTELKQRSAKRSGARRKPT